MQIIPLQAVPNQTLTVNLAGQVCQVDIYNTFYGLFVDLYVDGVLLIGGVIAQNMNRIVRSSYLGLIGDLTFVDQQGDSDPTYDGLGTRYALAYLEASDLP